MSYSSVRRHRRRVVTSAVIVVAAVALIADIIFGFTLAVNAATAAGLDFFQYAMLNKFGTFLLLWNYNPGAYLLFGAVFLGAFFTLLTLCKID